MVRSTLASSPALLPMSHIIASDAPLLSPPCAEATLPGSTSDDAFSYEPFTPYAPESTFAPALKARRASPDTSEPISCAPTHALFDFAPEDVPGTPSFTGSFDSGRASPAPGSPLSSTSIAPSKRAASLACSSADAKKPRQRMLTRDFVPPDVSGLSKREARLVKNRAAAFLSRQRKREEFETMEIRVAELEQENARLRGESGAESPQPETLLSEIEQLRAQLAAAEQRTSELNARLAGAAQNVVKSEPSEEADELPSVASSPRPANDGRRSRSSSVSSQKPERSGAGIGLMVLLCALPSLLSSQPSALPSQELSFPLSQSSAYPTPYAPSDPFDFSSGLMDIDGGDAPFVDSFGFDFDGLPGSGAASAFASARASPAPSSGSGASTLGFVDGERLGLGNLDISFESAREDGKIRVRIHPPAGSSLPSTPAYSPPHDPFFGVGEDEPRAPSPFAMPGAFSRAGSPFEFGEGAARRRVRIALKTAPTSEGEGGEWEVELC